MELLIGIEPTSSPLPRACCSKLSFKSISACEWIRTTRKSGLSQPSLPIASHTHGAHDGIRTHPTSVTRRHADPLQYASHDDRLTTGLRKTNYSIIRVDHGPVPRPSLVPAFRLLIGGMRKSRTSAPKGYRVSKPAPHHCSYTFHILLQRTGWDLNPRTLLLVADFPSRCLKPLGHLSI